MKLWVQSMDARTGNPIWEKYWQNQLREIYPPPQAISAQFGHSNWLTRTPLHRFCASVTQLLMLCPNLPWIYLRLTAPALERILHPSGKQFQPLAIESSSCSAKSNCVLKDTATSWRNNSTSSLDSLELENFSGITVFAPLHPFWIKLTSSARPLKLDSSICEGTRTTGFSLVCLAPTPSKSSYNLSLAH